MKKQGLRQFLTRYLSSWVVLGIDLSVAVGASALSLSVVSLWHHTLFASVSLPLPWVMSSLLSSLAGLWICRVHRSVIRHSTLRDAGRLCSAVGIKEALMLALSLSLPWLGGIWTLHPSQITLLFLLDAALTASGVLASRVMMLVIYDRLKGSLLHSRKRQRVLVYGTGDKSVALMQRLAQSPHYQVCGFLTRGPVQRDHTIAGRRVHYFWDGDGLTRLMRRLDASGVLFARESDAKAEHDGIIRHCTDSGLRVLIAPPIDEVVDGRVMRNSVRDVKIDDLLGRDEIKISMDEIRAEFRGRTILVTGAAGSIGSELCRQLAGFGVSKLVMFDNAETPMHNVRLEFEERYPDVDFVPVIGDVRIPARLDYVFRKWHPEIVFHAAAYKHVPLMEENPCEAVLVNVAGSRNVADKCVEYGARKMVMVSTDKAVNPTNIMGCTKRLAEIYVQSLGLALRTGRRQGVTRFVTTRFGNVLGSNGSVIPRFRQQIERGGPVTVTHPDITRFFMTIPEACRLVMEAATMTTGDQIFVFDMGESVRIADLARRMISLAGLRPGEDIAIEYTGLRPGEKLYEEVLATEEDTMPTDHDRIRIARVREYPYEEASGAVDALEELSRAVRIPEMVRLMKRTVPEFLSKNSPFEQFDTPNQDPPMPM